MNDWWQHLPKGKPPKHGYCVDCGCRIPGGILCKPCETARREELRQLSRKTEAECMAVNA